jgi:hypothetical protein
MAWAGLLAAEHWLHQSGVSHPDIDNFIDHAWRWSTISAEAFDDWYGALPRLQGLPALPADVIEEAHRVGVPAAELAALILSVDQLVYGNLFGGMQFEHLSEDLDGIAAVVERYELGLPPPERLPISSRNDQGGWGHSVDEATLTRIRTLDWTALESPGTAGSPGDIPAR